MKGKVKNMPTPRLRSDEIALRAHEIFIARGGEHGHDLEDWFQAESELLSQRIVRRRRAEVRSIGRGMDGPTGDARVKTQTTKTD